ncbi:hypothetical protein GALMADRAFT_215814 [Galerina marginata CBS 339.88]|uniref:Uncharacterized protein n=1 Tax=Galerina marginata (strain CBS 339.88) TaxID=685588 RepID=A0A067SKX9_GALM3|nr:hypothetical protein GALMADRAFT_215814 [Galerina marginata CBS 339.88]
MRFPLKLIIYPEDLPDDMQFDPNTEAIVGKNALPDLNAPITVASRFRTKTFVLPKNVTAAEVIELGLERFGILAGVVEEGDEVEEKTITKESEQRVRYSLTMAVKLNGQERDLAVSSKIIDVFPRPPYDILNTRDRRRSFHGSDPSGLVNDIRSDDPVFILRRATPYGTSPTSWIQPSGMGSIAALLNSAGGTDILLSDKAMFRSSRYETEGRIRYSYVKPDGETFDISDIIEEEWRVKDKENDVLEGVLDTNRDEIEEKLNRVLNRLTSSR